MTFAGNRRHHGSAGIQVYNLQMARLHFTRQLARFLTVQDMESSAPRLREALEEAFAANPPLRGYVLDDQSRLRENVVIFVDGRRARDPRLLDDPLNPGSMVYVMQALSGG